MTSPNDRQVELQSIASLAFLAANKTALANMALRYLSNFYIAQTFGGDEATFHAYYALLYNFVSGNAKIPYDKSYNSEYDLYVNGALEDYEYYNDQEIDFMT